MMRPAGLSEARAQCGALALVALVPDELHGAPEALDDRGGTVLRAVVDDDDLELVRQRLQPLDHLRDRLGLVEGRHDHRQLWLPAHRHPPASPR